VPPAPSVPAVASIPSPGPTSFSFGRDGGCTLYFLEREGSASHTATPAYPSSAELFSFPAVPGAQSAPSVPGFPSAAPLLSEAELSAIPATLADVTPLRASAIVLRILRQCRA